jgi:hypothetical protein
MSAYRRAARRAGALSLGLHAALAGGLAAALGRSGGAHGPVGVEAGVGRLTQDVGVVSLAVPEPPPAVSPPVAVAPAVPKPPDPLPPPVIQSTAAPVLSPPPPLPPSILAGVPGDDVRAAGHSPVPDRVVHTPRAPSPGPVGPSMPAGAVTAFFDVPAVGQSVVYVIDRSSSMGLDGRFDRARRQVVESLHRLPAGVRFQVIAYDETALPLRVHGASGLVSATPANVAAAAAALGAMAPEGGTGHERALRAALNLRPDVIYFLTDEDDLTPAVVRTVTRLNRGVSSVHALCLAGIAGGATPMRDLARQNRGVFRVVR